MTNREKHVACCIKKQEHMKAKRAAQTPKITQKSNSQQVNINIANIEKLSENSNEDVLQLSAASAQLTSLADQLQQEISAYKT